MKVLVIAIAILIYLIIYFTEKKNGNEYPQRAAICFIIGLALGALLHVLRKNGII